MPNPERRRGGVPTPAPQLEWRTLEPLGHAHFTQRGWRVLVSPYDTACYDFVVEKDGMFQRVNVKTASLSGTGYLITRSGRSAHRVDPDLYLAWIPCQRAFVEVPGPMLRGKSVRLSKKFISDQLEDQQCDS